VISRPLRALALLTAACTLSAVPALTAPVAAAGPDRATAAGPASADGPGQADCAAPRRTTRPVGAAGRLDRAPDHRQYSLRQLRRIDRRLHRTLVTRDQRGAATRFGLVLRIPVHVHVIDGRHTRGPGKRAVRRQLRVLNRAYDGGQSRRSTPTRFAFYLESLDRHRNQGWRTASTDSAADHRMRRRLHRGGPDALNLYFAAPQSPQAGTVVLGWSTMPWQARRSPRLDGVVIHQESLPGGALDRYNRGDTTVHEVGHWLGLFHTFEGGCSKRNDRVADTPAEAEPSLSCEVGRDTCEADGRDPVRNFMNYSYDSCMTLFTPGQVARMTDNWLAYRTP
jgi:hypothetical protein